MAWIEVHQSLLTHRKTLRLCRLLKMDKFAVTGRLMALWCWALDNAQDGELQSSDIDILADVMGWDGDPQVLVDALLSSGFLDGPLDDWCVQIHDWGDYAGKIADRRERNKQAMREARARDKAERVQHVDNTSEPRDATSRATVPNRTQPNHTVPSVTTSTKDANGGRAKKPPQKSLQTSPFAAIMARVPSTTQEKFTPEQIQKQFDRATAWVSEEETRFMSAKFFADWLEREIEQGHVIPDNLSEVEKIKRILQQKPNEKGLIDGQTLFVWETRLRAAKQLEEARAYEQRLAENVDYELYGCDEAGVVLHGPRSENGTT